VAMAAGEDGDTQAVDEVWYVSYGSNMSRTRLLSYLQGGRPPGGARAHPGARDPRPPRADMPVDLPGRVYFAGRSLTWGGGIAFYDHNRPGPTPARAYRITIGQFADITAQEMSRDPVPDSPVEQLLSAGAITGFHVIGPGRYETLVNVGEHEGLPMLTFTSPDGIDDVAHAAPTTAYQAMLAQGLRAGHGWPDEKIAAYLDDVLP